MEQRLHFNVTLSSNRVALTVHAGRVIERVGDAIRMFGIPSGGDYYHDIVEHILEHKEQNANSQMMITGHSLGGSYASMLIWLTIVSTVKQVESHTSSEHLRT